MEKFVFFTLNDFQNEGGGTIRMLGIINELAKLDKEITLISNIIDTSKIDQRIKLIPINIDFTRQDKRKFQFVLGTVGYKQLNKSFGNLFNRLKNIFSVFDENHKLIFFEYLDNSIAYWLKSNSIIKGYINDIHGIATNEFAFQAKKSKSLKSKVIFKIKENISIRLDKKVFNEADGIIYASDAMIKHYNILYPSLTKKKNYYLPYVLNFQNLQAYDTSLVSQFKKELNISENDFVFLFAGGFKETGGLQDLIKAFEKVGSLFSNAKLVLIGDGPSFNECKAMVQVNPYKNRIYLLGRQPYNYLTSFQELSNVLICPDRQNLFSDLIVHVKYLDALVSGKIVINGRFQSVMEINKDKELSLLFKPSDVEDLATKMIFSVENYDDLLVKFKDVSTYTRDNLVYKKYITNLLG